MTREPSLLAHRSPPIVRQAESEIVLLQLRLAAPLIKWAAAVVAGIVGWLWAGSFTGALLASSAIGAAAAAVGWYCGALAGLCVQWMVEVYRAVERIRAAIEKAHAPSDRAADR